MLAHSPRQSRQHQSWACRLPGTAKARRGGAADPRGEGEHTRGRAPGRQLAAADPCAAGTRASLACDSVPRTHGIDDALPRGRQQVGPVDSARAASWERCSHRGHREPAFSPAAGVRARAAIGGNRPPSGAALPRKGATTAARPRCRATALAAADRLAGPGAGRRARPMASAIASRLGKAARSEDGETAAGVLRIFSRPLVASAPSERLAAAGAAVRVLPCRWGPRAGGTASDGCPAAPPSGAGQRAALVAHRGQLSVRAPAFPRTLRGAPCCPCGCTRQGLAPRRVAADDLEAPLARALASPARAGTRGA